MITPDIQGFIAAQDRLRDMFGEDVTFHTPTAAEYPAGTKTDPETGRPYDPTIRPSAGGGFTDQAISVSVIFRPVGGDLEDDVGEGRMIAGLRRSTNVVLDIAVADFPTVNDATEATVKGRRYKITDFVDDGVIGVDRVLAFLEAK